MSARRIVEVVSDHMAPVDRAVRIVRKHVELTRGEKASTIMTAPAGFKIVTIGLGNSLASRTIEVVHAWQLPAGSWAVIEMAVT